MTALGIAAALVVAIVLAVTQVARLVLAARRLHTARRQAPEAAAALAIFLAAAGEETP